MDTNDMGKRQRRYSIRTRIALAVVALVLAQGIIFMCLIIFTGVISKYNTATYSILSNQANSRKSEMQEVLNTYRRNITYTSMQMSEKIDGILEANNMQNITLSVNNETFNEILEYSIDELISFTKYNSVSGVFVVLDPTINVADKSIKSRAAMYIRDSSPNSVFANNSNLLLEYGRVDIARQRGVAVDYLWTQDMDFSGLYSRDFYYKPIDAAMKDDDNHNRLQLYGYWSPKFVPRKDDLSIITYSLPLILSNGTIFGVMGFEIDATSLSNMMKASEIPYDNGFYILSANKGGGVLNDAVAFSGAYARFFLSGPSAKLNFEQIFNDNKGAVNKITTSNFPNRSAIGASSKIALYENNSPFINEEWSLICIAPYDSIMFGSNSIRNSVIVSIISTLAFALILSVFIVFFISNPINRLSAGIKNINPKNPVRFEKTNIVEIDELSGAFEILSDRVSEAALRMFKIIELVDMPLGSFETDLLEGSVHLSKSLFELLGFPAPADGSSTIPMDVWTGFIKSLEVSRLTQNEDGVSEALYVTKASAGVKRWFRVRFITEDERDIGVLIDATDEIAQLQRLEYERNYDPLTKLLNRNAFLKRAAEIIGSQPDTTGITMFADLDDLKFINDTYGHEFGDKYIKAFSEFLNRFKEIGAAVSRISGDEFVAFMCGFSSRAEARLAFNEIMSELGNTKITTEDGLVHRIRVSVGLSYFPSDSRDIEELIKFADYAMYEIKHANKGEVKEFNLGDYNKNSFVIKMKHVLSTLMEERKLRFAFQPVINVKTGGVFAYEALLRSMMGELKSPNEILEVARTQSKLYDLETLTLDVLLGWLDRNYESTNGCKIFVNTIPGQVLSKNDIDKISDKYGQICKSLVFKIAEKEFLSKDETIKKIEVIRQLGSMIAIDKYGSDYSDEMAFLSIKPDFLKIDMDIIRDIDKDADKQHLVQSIVSLAHKKSIMTVADGVETYEEMRMLAGFGIDYMHGFFFAYPGFELTGITENKRRLLLEASST